MFCPETILLNREHLYIVRHDRGDYNDPRRIPWRERFNPLRIELVFRVGRYPNIRRIRINRGAAAHRRLSDLTWWLWREKQWQRRQREERRP